MKTAKSMIPLGILILVATGLAGQDTPQRPALPRTLKTIDVTGPPGAIISFRPRGTTTIVLRGTELNPRASISLKVESRPGFVEIDINRGEIRGLDPAWTFGPDFLTYVLWVVSVDGAASNIGEITFEEERPVSINVSTTYQTFWMMVTAEPDFAVHDPSPVVMLVSQSQANVSTGNKGFAIPGRLTFHTNYSDYTTGETVEPDPGLPGALLQARKAVEFASKSGVLAQEASPGTTPPPEEQRAQETLAVARSYLAQAELELQRSGSNEQTIQFARTATQIAENARALALGAVGGLAVIQLSREIDNLRSEMESLRGSSEELAQVRRQLAEAQDELEALRASKTELEEQLNRARAELQQQQDRLAQLEAALDQERQLARDVEGRLPPLRERVNLLENQLQMVCGELRSQLSSFGQLTQRGGELVLTLASDILFDFDKYDLRPAARETLARLAVVRLILFPEAQVRYEGHTDLVGEADYNQWLSEQRALQVYRYFLQDQLAYGADDSERAQVQEILNRVDRLLQMSFPAAQRAPQQRQQLLSSVSDTVVGKGMREPVVPTEGPNEQNRRVTLTFPRAQVGQVTSLCDTQPQTPVP